MSEPDLIFHFPLHVRALQREQADSDAPDSILGVSIFSGIAPDQFGRFNVAFVTMFRIAAGDTWVDALPALGPDGSLEWKPALFISSFIVISVWVVLQVSVAVLLDNFVSRIQYCT